MPNHPPTPDPSPPRAVRAGGGEEERSPRLVRGRIPLRHIIACPARRFPRPVRGGFAAGAAGPRELSGGGCNPVDEPRPASPRLIAGLSNSASAGPIGCTSGRLAFDFGVLTGFFGVSGFFAMMGIWDESGAHKRAKADAGNADEWSGEKPDGRTDGRSGARSRLNGSHGSRAFIPRVIEAWRTSCPRLTIWEDAVDRGYVTREPRCRNWRDSGDHPNAARNSSASMDASSLLPLREKVARTQSASDEGSFLRR